MPSEVKLVDNEATQVTADLYAYLKALGRQTKSYMDIKMIHITRLYINKVRTQIQKM